MRYCLLIIICAVFAGLSASEDTAYRLLAAPMPWADDVILKTFYDSSTEEELETNQDIQMSRLYATSAIKLHDNETNTYLLELSAESVRIDTSSPVIFPDSGTEVPDKINAYDFGIAIRHMDEKKRRWVTSLGVRSSSDDLKDDDDAVEYRAFAAVFVPDKGMNGWTFGLNYYSHNDYPLPLVSYMWMPDRNFRAVVGLPFFMIMWKPNENWELNWRNFALNPGFEAKYKIDEGWSAFSRISRDDAWDGYVEERSDEDLELSLRAWRAGIGAEYAINKSDKIRLEVGYEFERELVETDGWDLFDKDDEEIDIDEATYLRATVSWSF